jgi:integrase
MPWRKYNPKKGKFGPIYQIAKGIQVRRDHRGKWVLFVNAAGERKNRTIGQGRKALVKAVRAAETIGGRIDTSRTGVRKEPPKPKKPAFLDFCQQWLKESAGRWSDFTIERYDQIFRLYLKPEPMFKRSMDRIGRRDIKSFLRRVADRRSPATVESVHGVISGVFNEAIDEEIVEANPAAGILKTILPPKNQRDLKDPEPFSLKERDRFLAYAERVGTRVEALMLKVMAFAGFRLGETLAMRREYLDDPKSSYFVAQSYKGRKFRKPKLLHPEKCASKGA